MLMIGPVGFLPRGGHVPHGPQRLGMRRSKLCVTQEDPCGTHLREVKREEGKVASQPASMTRDQWNITCKQLSRRSRRPTHKSAGLCARGCFCQWEH